MEFTFDINYNQKAVTAMTKAIRVILHGDKDKKSKITGWCFVAVGAAILLFSDRFSWAQLFIALILVAFACYLIWGDHFDAFSALKKLPEDMRTGQWCFREDGYVNNTAAGESRHSYEDIFTIMESEGYIFLMLDNGAVQILELSTIKGGTAADFRRLLRKKTDLTIQEA